MLTKVRKGEIAVLFVKAKMRQDGVRVKPGLRREIANMAKDIGVPFNEALEFVEEISREMFEEAFRSEFSGPNASKVPNTDKRQFFETLPDRTKG